MCISSNVDSTYSELEQFYVIRCVIHKINQLFHFIIQDNTDLYSLQLLTAWLIKIIIYHSPDKV